MTTDNKELTFVRCPTCGSLVPAVSSRCKMCGAGLDFESSKKGSDAGKAPRARQKTGEAVTKVASEDDKDIALDDPLSAYIDELEDEDKDFDDLDEDLDDLDDYLDDEPSKPVSKEKVEKYPEQESKEEKPVKKAVRQSGKKMATEQKKKEVKKQTPNFDGTLVGWLVNYDQERGEALELRVGKYFVTANSIKDTDFIIEDSSISSPHALLTVKDWEQVLVQDLMSNSGTYYSSADGDDSEQKDEVFKLENNSKVQFGNKEYLVVLIAKK